MKIPALFLLSSLVMLMMNCAKEKESETEEMQQTPAEMSQATAPGMPQLSDDYYVGIYEAQELIKIFNNDKSFRQDYCKRAYLKEYGLFISMGIGRLKNPETGQPIPQHLARRAADLDARRWAGYGEQWLSANFEPPFGELKASFNKTVTPLGENIVGDSLFVFIATHLEMP